MVAAVVVLAVLFGADCIRAAFETAPALTTRQTLAASLVVPGPPPAPTWPSAGEAAVEVEGLPSIGSSGGERPLPVASLAKMMTAYVILQDHPLAPGQSGFTYTVTAADVADYDQRAAQAQSVVPVTRGESLTELQLLEGLLVPSANNFAVILADHESGSTAAFVSLMNATATRLGMTHTTYTDPAGLEASTVSTAGDQLALAARAMAIPLFARIVGMTSVDLPVAGVVANFNTEVGTSGYVGIKTGSDSEAGGCLAFANRQEVGGHEVTVLGVVLGQDTGTMSTPVLIAAAEKASSALVSSVRDAVSVRTLLPAGAVVAEAVNAQGRTVALRTTGSLSEVAYGGEKMTFDLTLRPPGRSLSAQEPLGRLRVGSDGPSTPVEASAAMPAVSFTWKLLHGF